MEYLTQYIPIQCSLHFKTTHWARKCGLKLKVVLKWRNIYIESIWVGSLVDGLKMEGLVKWRVLKLQGQLYCDPLPSVLPPSHQQRPRPRPSPAPAVPGKTWGFAEGSSPSTGYTLYTSPELLSHAPEGTDHAEDPRKNPKFTLYAFRHVRLNYTVFHSCRLYSMHGINFER